ncbi:MAG: carbamoyltransferase HypF [Nitrospirae bacterium]|nr:carbamoyltransferase HypF [Nitrospirota bacterium]
MAGRVRITVTGVVQGVGFRPAVYNLAVCMGLAGYVLNNSSGVVIEVEGQAAVGFAQAVIDNTPPLASIKTIDIEHLPPAGYTGFEIRFSEAVPGEFALVSPDIATCPDCLREAHDPADRRHLYPFTNCTNCGPRYSIVEGVPYDRPLTTMRAFTMCPVCKAEYDNPADRRFHAQPVACPACGPKTAFRGEGSGAWGQDDPVIDAVLEMLAGGIVAIKGLGGYQLACDATDSEAVKTLRERKRKGRKPFAVMAKDVDTVRLYCEVSPAEEALLTGRERPIVLLRKKVGAAHLAEDVAPGALWLGFMLPCTPLHDLLFNHPDIPETDRPRVLVMTSGNLSEEPIVIDNTEAVEKLSHLADAFLSHDRDIYMRVDDSVARVVAGVPRIIRRARGYVPTPIDLGHPMPEIFACGGELKNTLCLTKGSYAIPSQHIGDLASHEAFVFYEETLKNLKRTFSADPKVVAHDMHPDYMSTRFAQEYRTDGGDPPTLIPVQHHHAHIAACMAENGVSGAVIGVAFDGTGYGTDGRIWGSEFLVAGYAGFERFAHMNYIPLPGGDRAVREPWRTALSLLVQACGDEAAGLFTMLKGKAVSERDSSLVLQMLAKGVNSPLSCGMGRLFDGVSSLIGVMDVISFEGEAAIGLETAAWRAAGGLSGAVPYPYELSGVVPAVIDTVQLIRAIVEDALNGVARESIALRFHATVADMVFRVCKSAREARGLETVALSGGVFQNALLFEAVEAGLMSRGFRVLSHSKMPTNDGCVSLGQAVVAAANLT